LKLKTISNASTGFGRAGSRARVSTWPPTKSKRDSPASPSRSQSGSGTQSLSVNARMAPRLAATPALRAGPAPWIGAGTTRAVGAASCTAARPQRELLSATTISKPERGQLCAISRAWHSRSPSRSL